MTEDTQEGGSDLPGAEDLKSLTPQNSWLLSLLGLFTGIGGAMVMPLRSVFLVTVLQTPLPIVGLIIGIAECSAIILGLVSGRLALRPESRKPLLLLGYAVSNAVRPLLSLVASWPVAFPLLFLDRAGKGFRSGPRDSLLAASVSSDGARKASNFYRTTRVLAASIGSLFAAAILFWTVRDIGAVFAWTLVPGALAILIVLILVVRKVVGRGQTEPVEPSIATGSDGGLLPWANLGVRFWMFTGIATLFALGNSADDFLFLRTAALEQSLFVVPLVFLAYNLAIAALSNQVGRLSARWGRLPLLISGYGVFALIYAGWALANQAWNTWLLFVIYGIYTGATEGIARALVLDLVPSSKRWIALAWFGGLTGLAVIPSNILAGWLWVAGGPSATFWFGAFMAVIAVTLLLAWLPWLRRGFPSSRIDTA